VLSVRSQTRRVHMHSPKKSVDSIVISSSLHHLSSLLCPSGGVQSDLFFVSRSVPFVRDIPSTVSAS
jgi:hypothetical protein